MQGLLQYALARFEADTEAELYQVYVTDSLKSISDALCAFASGKCVNTPRYYDWVHGITPKTDERTPEQIIADVIKNAGLEVVGE